MALLPENGRVKELDITVAEKLRKMYNFEENAKIVYEKLWKAHNDVSKLTPKQMLFKDLKVIENIPVPGLPMLASDFLTLENSHEALKDFAQEQNASLVLVIGLDATTEVKRDVAIFFQKESNSLKNLLLEKFNNSEMLKGYNFSFTTVSTIYDDIVCLRQHNTKLSRKHLIPLLKECLAK